MIQHRLAAAELRRDCHQKEGSLQQDVGVGGGVGPPAHGLGAQAPVRYGMEGDYKDIFGMHFEYVLKMFGNPGIFNDFFETN